MEGTMELTDREKMIAAGEDPDAVVESDTQQDGGGSEPAQEAVASDGSGGGTEAAGSPAVEGAAAPETWITDETRSLAKSYGMDEDEVKSFSRKEEFDAVASYLDRKLKKKPAEPEPEAATAQPGTPEAETPAEPDDLDVQKFVDGGFDEETVKIVKYAKNLKAEIEAIRQEAKAAESRAAEREFLGVFHATADGGATDLYGRTAEGVSKDCDANRKAVFEAMQDIANRLVASGQEVPPVPVLFRRAEKIALGEKLAAKEEAARRAALTAQSAKRRPSPGGSRARGAPVKKTGSDDVDVANDPRVVKLWNKFQEENGNS